RRRSGARFSCGPDQTGERAKLAIGRGSGEPLDGAIVLNDLLPDRSEDRPTPAAAAGRSGDRRLAQRVVDLLDEKPGTPIGHAKAPRRRRDRTGGTDRLEQRDLAGTDAVAARQIEPDGKVRI